jgi:two-component system sensor histidine kinase TctE
VNDLLTRLKDSLATQKRFLANAAHQLKTPLAGLRMQADLAQREENDADALKQSLKQIGHASVRATHTVNQLLALARAEDSGRAMTLHPCNLAEITMDAVRDFLPYAMDKHIDLGYEGAMADDRGVTLSGNRTLLKEAISNLLDNALNYTPSSAESPAVITARVVADPFGQVLVMQVEDSGPGIPAAERALVLQPFYRALGTNVDGSGLGLSIVNEIVKQHHGEIQIEPMQAGASMPGTRISLRFRIQNA